MQQTSAYLMDDAREPERLAGKAEPEQFVATYLQPYLEGAKAVLDVGCGPAVIARAVAQECPGAEVVGVDGSGNSLAAAERNLAGLENARAVYGSTCRSRSGRCARWRASAAPAAGCCCKTWTGSCCGITLPIRTSRS